jgi:hypothetical protein
MGVHPALEHLRRVRGIERTWISNVQKAALNCYMPKYMKIGMDLVEELVGTTSENQGMQRLQDFDDAIKFLSDHRGVKLSAMQEKMVNVGRVVIMKKIFGASLPRYYNELLRKYNVPFIRQQASVVLPRRSGKTVGLAVIVAALLVSQPDGNVVNFALQGRQAKEWLGVVDALLFLFKDSPFDWTSSERNANEYIEINNRTGTTARVSCFPGPRDEDASNYRGVGSKLLLMVYDEFYFFKECIYRTTLPLVKMDAGILMVSSMARKSGTAVDRMIHQKLEDNTDLFIRIDWIRACPDCIEAGTQDKCNHILQVPQHFESSEANRRVGMLMEVFGKEDLMREIFNAGARNTRENIFTLDQIQPLRDPNHVYRATSGDVHQSYFVGFDPAGGGRSKCVIVSGFVDRDTWVITSTEVLPNPNITTHDAAKYLIEHAESIRIRIPGLSRAKAIFCIENNSIMVAPSVAQAIQSSRFTNYTIACEPERVAYPNRLMGNESVVRPGIRTVQRNKEQLLATYRYLLDHRLLRFHEKFYFPHPELHFPVTSEMARDQFADELANMCIYEDTSRRVREGTIPPCKYGGWTSDGQRANDDKLMALGFCILCHPFFS